MNEVIEIPVAEYRDRMLSLRNERGFDFLESFTGMDWGETLGVVCHLESTATGERIVVKTAITNREQPELPSVCDIWKAAELNEREVFDFFGIRFVNHPDMRRLYLREDWVGYPLRKDYDASEQ
ncbi:MAG: NADH-quinone oxidoreductase subunit C, partial [Alistipes sp.]